MYYVINIWSNHEFWWRAGPLGQRITGFSSKSFCFCPFERSSDPKRGRAMIRQADAAIADSAKKKKFELSSERLLDLVIEAKKQVKTTQFCHFF